MYLVDRFESLVYVNIWLPDTEGFRSRLAKQDQQVTVDYQSSNIALAANQVLQPTAYSVPYQLLRVP